jgi:hypothetical protein
MHLLSLVYFHLKVLLSDDENLLGEEEVVQDGDCKFLIQSLQMKQLIVEIKLVDAGDSSTLKNLPFAD